MANDMERCAIIAAHYAECAACDGNAANYAPLSKREQAIVELRSAAFDAWMDRAHEAEAVINKVRELARRMYEEQHPTGGIAEHGGNLVALNYDDLRRVLGATVPEVDHA